MIKIVHRANERGVSEHGWLSSRFSFSFADWYEPTRMGFGALRVLNDDTIAPRSGFPPHSHRDMEIITIVTRGAVSHTDSLGNTYEVPANDVQVMSAGTGVTHAEMNTKDVPLELFQIWIEPSKKNQSPRYAQRAFGEEALQLLVSPDGKAGSLSIGQDAYITKETLVARSSYAYPLHKGENGVYVFVVSGLVLVSGELLGSRDAMGISKADTIQIDAQEDTTLLFIEVPMASYV